MFKKNSKRHLKTYDMRKKSATRTLKHDENEVFGLIEVIRPPTILRRKRPYVGARKKNPLVLYTNYYKTILLCIAIPRKTQNLFSL